MKVSNDCADAGDQAHDSKPERNQARSVCISAAQFEEIEKAGQIELSEELRAEIETVLNSYILRSGWDRNTRPSKEAKAQSQSLKKHVIGILDALDDVSRKLRGEGAYHAGVALSNQDLFWRAGIMLIPFYDQLLSLLKELESDGIKRDKGGRPKDHFLTQFFCELQDIFRRAGGRVVGVTKTIDGRRESPFTDFVNAILRFAPVGIGPSSSPAVAVAWERQLLSRQASTAQKT